MTKPAILLFGLALAVGCAKPGGEGSSACLDVDGASRMQIEEMFGRSADHIERYDAPLSDQHFWYFGDDDAVVLSFDSGNKVDSYVWHDGDQFMTDRAECPLSEPGPEHPATFNIDEQP